MAITDTQNTAADLDAPLWGAVEIAQVIKRTPRQTEHLLRTKQIDATRKSGIWVSTPRRLLKSLGAL